MNMYKQKIIPNSPYVYKKYRKEECGLCWVSLYTQDSEMDPDEFPIMNSKVEGS